MTRGGKREGAGRPFGTKKEPTVMMQRRVKKEWIPFIDDFIRTLKENSKKGLLLLILYLFTLPCFAFEYTIDTAREEALKNIPVHCMLSGEAYNRIIYKRNLDRDKILTTQTVNNRYIDVVYKDIPNVAYRYEYKQKGIYEQGGYYGNSVQIKYNDNGINKIAIYNATWLKLLGVVLDISNDEKYSFDMDGNLLEYIRGKEHKKYRMKWSTAKKHSAMYSES